MDHEWGLIQLTKLAIGTSWYFEYLGYEARLKENLQNEKQYGSTEITRSERIKITTQLNILVYEKLNISFNDLCSNRKIDYIQEETPPPDHSKEQSRINAPIIPNPLLLHPTFEKVHPPSSGKVLVSCSSKDRAYLEELRTHLEQDIREGNVICYDDAEIYPITMWKKEREKVVQAASMAILLLSTDFLKSVIVLQDELPYLLTSARAEKMAILCVILRPCSFQQTELAHFKTINPPPKAPLNIMNRNEREKIWIQVVENAKNHIKSV